MIKDDPLVDLTTGEMLSPPSFLVFTPLKGQRPMYGWTSMRPMVLGDDSPYREYEHRHIESLTQILF